MKKALLPAVLLVLYWACASGAATIDLAWEPSPNPKVVGYKVHYGTQSRTYTEKIDVKGRIETKASITGLEDGKTYYFAVTAYDARGKESSLGEELSTGPGKEAVKEGKGMKLPPTARQAQSPGPESGGPGNSKIPPRQGVITSDGKIAPTRGLRGALPAQTSSSPAPETGKDPQAAPE